MDPDQNTRDTAPGVAPKVAPESLALRAQPRAVTRLNRRTLAVLAGGLAMLVLAAAMWSLRPAGQRAGQSPTELYNVDRVSRSEGLEQLPADYAGLPKQVPMLGPPLPGDLGPAILRSQQPAVASYAAAGGEQPQAAPDLGHKEAQDALASPVFFRSSSQQSASAQDPASARSADAPASAGLPSLSGNGPASAAASDPAVAQNAQPQKEAFANGVARTDAGAAMLQPPSSPYQVMAGTVIAAALVTGINSDLPGEVIASVTEPIYDTATGHFLLIPQGARILGRYNSQVSYGQGRVQVVWNRIILPDTSSFTLDNLVGSDPAGQSGLQDEVDWHWARLFAGAALTTMVGVAAELAAPESSQDGERVIVAGRESLQDSVNQVGQEITRRNLNLQPTLIERPGLPVRVIVNRDLILRPYQPLFFSREDPR